MRIRHRNTVKSWASAYQAPSVFWVHSIINPELLQGLYVRDTVRNNVYFKMWFFFFFFLKHRPNLALCMAVFLGWWAECNRFVSVWFWLCFIFLMQKFLSETIPTPLLLLSPLSPPHLQIFTFSLLEYTQPHPLDENSTKGLDFGFPNTEYTDLHKQCYGWKTTSKRNPNSNWALSLSLSVAKQRAQKLSM